MVFCNSLNNYPERSSEISEIEQDKVTNNTQFQHNVTWLNSKAEPCVSSMFIFLRNKEVLKLSDKNSSLECSFTPNTCLS